MLRSKLLLAFIAGMATTIVGTSLAQQYGAVLFPDVIPSDYFADAVNRFARQSIIVNSRCKDRFGSEFAKQSREAAYRRRRIKGQRQMKDNFS